MRAANFLVWLSLQGLQAPVGSPASSQLSSRPPPWVCATFSVQTANHGFSGIGAAIAKAFAQAGCKCIAITDIVASRLEETREEIIAISPEVVVLTAAGDIADERFVNAFINSVTAETGRIDYAV